MFIIVLQDFFLFFFGSIYLVFYKLLVCRGISLSAFSSMVLLKIFSGPMSWKSSTTVPIILRFGPFRVSQISWIFCLKKLFRLKHFP